MEAGEAVAAAAVRAAAAVVVVVGMRVVVVGPNERTATLGCRIKKRKPSEGRRCACASRHKVICTLASCRGEGPASQQPHSKHNYSCCCRAKQKEKKKWPRQRGGTKSFEEARELVNRQQVKYGSPASKTNPTKTELM